MYSLTLYLPGGKLDLELNDTETAKLVYQGSPYQAQAQLYGEEVYFSIPIRLEQETPVSTVEIGDIAYWPPGQAICLFFGPTPDSAGDLIKPASDVTIIGKMKGDLSLLKEVQAGDIVTVQF